MNSLANVEVIGDGPRARTRRRGKLPIRCLAVVLAAILVVSHTAHVWHELTVRHVVCAEHGESIDAATVAPAPGEAERQAQVETGPGPRESTGHAHCGFAALAHGAAETPPALVACDAPPTWFPTSFQAPATPPPAIPALHLAPKTSPPSSRASIS